jgi:hypothetical protein
MLRTRAVAITVGVSALVGMGVLPRASALDRPIGAVKLLLTRSSTGKERLAFVSKDPGFLFPPVSGADDPAAGSPGGALIELFSQEGAASLAVPRGVGKPGWTIKSAAAISYKFSNGDAPGGISPVRAATIKQGKVLKLTSADSGVPLAVSQGRVGIRITTGSLRSCALFDAPTIRTDEPGRFIAKGAVASSLADCADASLAICGNGVRDAGEQCDPPDVEVCELAHANGCFPPGGRLECQCCGGTGGSCFGMAGIPCCDADDICVFFAHPGMLGRCASRLCGSPGQACDAGQQCVGGACCSELGMVCGAGPPENWAIPCCGQAVCARPDIAIYTACCLPGEQPCTASSDCCSNSCNAGTGLCDP